MPFKSINLAGGMFSTSSGTLFGGAEDLLFIKPPAQLIQRLLCLQLPPRRQKTGATVRICPHVSNSLFTESGANGGHSKQ
ncbi:hypothetical protein SLA2020_389190 [Shorea laevis]